MKKEVNYYWCHHMMSTKDRDAIQKCINEADYFGFIEWYKKYNSKGITNAFYSEEFDSLCPIIYLPDEAYVYDVEENKIVGYLNILERENFMKITHSENECG